MVKRLSLLACALLLTTAARADVVTKKFDWAPGANGVQKLDFEWNNLSVGQVIWNLGDTLKPLRVSSASAEVRVDNNGFLNQVVGIAIAVFDEQGNMIAAGSGGNKVGHLNKGERDHFRVAFPYVYRNLDKAKSFYLTLETGAEKWKAKEPAKAPSQ
jgi:hypothetical protein